MSISQPKYPTFFPGEDPKGWTDQDSAEYIEVQKHRGCFPNEFMDWLATLEIVKDEIICDSDSNSNSD